MATEIKQTLFRNYQLDLNIETIQELTFDNLIKLVNEKNKTAPEKAPTASNFTFLTPTDTVIEIKCDKTTKNIFFLHPIEGHIQHMLALAEKMIANVYGLQCTAECHFQTIQEYAKFYEKLIRKIQKDGPYTLCGYSYGTLLALEIGFLLQAEKENVKMIFIDCSPEYVKSAISDKNVEKLNGIPDNNLLETFAVRFPEITRTQVRIDLNLFLFCHKNYNQNKRHTIDWQYRFFGNYID